ncbi:Inner membrane protein [Azotobacter vinelandii CA]|uniref:Inner membrane protein n=3 Tax=Azotobacter vinelandii TaxID=354 RepID=C1DPK8_AZOVD|nr:regulatory signaling modulator protein AmpE [Azotobacter vinelandii]AAF73951.1 AmpE [Azotobacter vinelandii]ACO77440.1 Inner membrane protein [Azotobacter vinelandii DJ]AGK13253.1 Inner membrane protein [Azotobacter vinelandii CA]AGK17542.1 Inner membrane protein [Azotobacter vinelandii CA6]SFY07517.1 AmpE protein [Azotobacter vinelandii]
MTFLVLLLALLVERFSRWRLHIQQDIFWLRLLDRVETNPDLAGDPRRALFRLVLLSALVLGVLLALLSLPLYGWLALPLHVFVLVYSLGRGDILTELKPFREAWRRGDSEAACLAAERDLAVGAEESLSLLRRVQGYLLWQAYQSFFAVIFWYALLGPVAVLAYRLTALTGEHTSLPALREHSVRLRHLLDWLPARGLALSFALVGNFGAVFRVLLRYLSDREVPAAKVVIEAGRAANEGLEAEVLAGEAGLMTLDELWQLLVRAGMLWYVVMALAILFL